jgi:hypothetical protein
LPLAGRIAVATATFSTVICSVAACFDITKVDLPVSELYQKYSIWPGCNASRAGFDANNATGEPVRRFICSIILMKPLGSPLDDFYPFRRADRRVIHAAPGR